jgi:hypothetical protein
MGTLCRSDTASTRGKLELPNGLSPATRYVNVLAEGTGMQQRPLWRCFAEPARPKERDMHFSLP